MLLNWHFAWHPPGPYKMSKGPKMEGGLLLLAYCLLHIAIAISVCSSILLLLLLFLYVVVYYYCYCYLLLLRMQQYITITIAIYCPFITTSALLHLAALHFGPFRHMLGGVPSKVPIEKHVRHSPP